MSLFSKILYSSSLGSSNKFLGNFIWAYQDFAAGVINSTAVTLTANNNGLGALFDVSKITGGTAAIFSGDNPLEYVYTSAGKMFGTLITVNAHTSASITLNKIPNPATNIRIWYKILATSFPENYSTPPLALQAKMLDNMDAILLTQDELDDSITTTSNLWSASKISNEITSITLADTDDLPEGSTNLYFTNARVESYLNGGDGINFSSGQISADIDTANLKITSSKINTIQNIAQLSSPTFANLTLNDSSGALLSVDSSLGTAQAEIKLKAGNGATNRASRLDFLNIPASPTVPRWTLINDFQQNGTNDFSMVDASSNRVITFQQGGSIGIGTSNPNGAAALDIVSTSGSIIIPRMTTTQKNALSAINGSILYDETTNQFNFYENGSWVIK